MSLQAIEASIEKIAVGFGSAIKKTFSSGKTWKAMGKPAAIGAGIGAVGNVALGDKDQSIAERALKGGAAGGLAGGLYGAAKPFSKNMGWSGKANRVKKATKVVNNAPEGV